ncbi:stalk domain-containing protein [Peribacillus alkalitolerans]|uniref:stalk domain-containing protein n=1 Tax=Peribacillus alkalitolerans TaxID=1550385 RepID=UPI0013D27551|nr:stalk domain-containing protein [Peribacillus alkalitolerans]
MIRTFLTTLLLISITICGMLFWQWNLFSASPGIDTQAEKRSDVYQKIKMKQSEKVLSIHHEISGLQEESYIVENLRKIKFTCTYDEKTECKWDKENHLLIPNNQKQVVFTYEFTAPTINKSTLYNRVFLSLKNIQFEKSRVEITSTVSRPAYWFSSAPLIGKTKKDYIEYSVFEQSGNMFALYYSPVEMELQKSDRLKLYYEKGQYVDLNKIESTLAILPNNKVLTLIVTNTHPEYISDSFVISSDVSKPDRLLQQLFTLDLQSLFNFENKDEKWIMYVLGNLKYNRKFGGEKSQLMADAIRSELAENELKQLLTDTDNSQFLSAKLLDEFLTKAKGRESHFFANNKLEKAGLSPLFFVENRLMQVNDSEVKEKMIMVQNQSLYPFYPVIHKLGYEYHVIDQNQVLVNKNNSLIRFYLNKNVFMINGDDYGVKTNPLKAVNGSIYITEDWLLDIFRVNILKGDKVIQISNE